MSRVAILITPQVSLFELGCATELFALARPEMPNWYRTDVVAFHQGESEGTGGILIRATHIENLSNYDVLVVPNWDINSTDVPQQLADSVTDLYNRGGRLLSFCSGAFLFAQLGLLDGQPVTTHWRYAETFKQRFPRCLYQEDVLYVLNEQIGCSAGSSAGIDLGIEVIRQDHGHKIANQVARRMVLAAHRSGGQAQYVEKPVTTSPNMFNTTVDWALQNLTSKISINDLAQKASMSRRSFDRKFRQTFGTSATQWLTEQKLQSARMQLEDSNLSIDQVAYSSGFDSPLTFRHHFKNLLGITPTDYRKQFQRTSTTVQKTAK